MYDEPNTIGQRGASVVGGSTGNRRDIYSLAGLAWPYRSVDWQPVCAISISAQREARKSLLFPLPSQLAGSSTVRRVAT